MTSRSGEVRSAGASAAALPRRDGAPDRKIQSALLLDPPEGEVRRLRCWSEIDQARLTGRPSLLLCTSGTAAANYFPALVEASMPACTPWRDASSWRRM